MKEDTHETRASLLTWDGGCFLVNGRREFMISGEVHFARSPHQLWPAILDRCVACGLNWIASYVFWNLHEPNRDAFDFSGDRDLRHFIELCAERGLKVFLRIGPYCCAEWNYGGFPSYLRDEPGVVFRTWNQPYMARVETYFHRLISEFRPCLATYGGPVHLVQVENEYVNVGKRYGADGQRYIRWIAEITRQLGVDVPLVMCETGGEAIPGVLSTLNGFLIEQKRIDLQRAQQPHSPLIWTELWTGWYDTWGYQHHLRERGNIAFHLFDFISRGGSGWNYYMWHGGTNFGRNSMYLQTTSYDYDAPLDEYGEVTAKGAYLAELHRILRLKEELLLSGQRRIENNRVIWALGTETLTLELDTGALSGRLIGADGKIIIDTAADSRGLLSGFASPKWEACPPIAHWLHWSEPLPAERADAAIAAEDPVDQLRLTQDQSDYCWYSTQIRADGNGVQELRFDRAGDVLTIFLDGRPIARSQPPFLENRGPTLAPGAESQANDVNPLELMTSHFEHCFAIDMTGGMHQLDVLAASLGLIRGDWSISSPMQFERKGIWDRVWHNAKIVAPWSMHPCLAGERIGLPADSRIVKWSDGTTAKACTWHLAHFNLPADRLSPGMDFRLDAMGLGKGLLFLNGHAVGRHWLIEGVGVAVDDPWHINQPAGLILDRSRGPTQRFYHLPLAWLRGQNELLVFEEYETVDMSTIRLECRRRSSNR